MYQAPEVFHLQEAVNAVKRALIPEIEKQPSKEVPEPGQDKEESEESEER